MARSNIKIKKKEVYCPNCGSIGKPKLMTKGSIAIEILLWLCLIVPGLLYSLWRQTTKYKVCQYCLSENTIPGTAPNVHRMIEERFSTN